MHASYFGTMSVPAPEFTLSLNNTNVDERKDNGNNTIFSVFIAYQKKKEI